MRKISLLMLFALAFLFNAKATDIWTGSKYVTWGNGLQIAADQFAAAQPGNLIKVHFTGATDGIEFKVMNTHFDHLAGSRESAGISGDGAFEQFLTPTAVDSLKAYGLEIIGANFTCTKVELLESKTLKEGFTVWTGFFWADEWTTLELYRNGYAGVDWSDYSALRVYHEAGRSDFVINVILNAWPKDGGENVANQEAMTAGEGYMELPLTDELRTKLAEASKWMIQFNKEGGDPFNVTDIVLVEKPYLWKGNQHVDYGESSVIALDKALFATATAGQKLIVKYATDAEKKIELKVKNEHFDHLAGSREQAKLNGNGRFEHFLTPKAVEELKAYGLEIGGNGFYALRVELEDGKPSLPEGVNVWTGYFWADEWTTLELYWNGYRYVDFNDVKAIRFYSEANRSDFELNVRDSWGDDGEIANIGDMTAGEGYMELPLTNDMREKIANSEHLLVQFNKKQGDPFNVTDIVLVMEEPYTRTVTNGNYGTICLSRAAATIEGATMYRIVGGNADEGITIEEVALMEAGKPYIFQASADQLTVTMTGARADVQTANGLIGNLGESAIIVPQNGHSYVLSTNLLYLVNSDVTIAPNRAYIDMDAIIPVAPAQGAKRRVIATYNQATGIEDASATFVGPEKIFENGVLYILRDGVKYNATGARVQ